MLRKVSLTALLLLVACSCLPVLANVASCGLQPTEQQCKSCCDSDYDACTEHADSYFNHCGSYWDICYENCHQVQCAPSDPGCYPSSTWIGLPAWIESLSGRESLGVNQAKTK